MNYILISFENRDREVDQNNRNREVDKNLHGKRNRKWKKEGEQTKMFLFWIRCKGGICDGASPAGDRGADTPILCCLAQGAQLVPESPCAISGVGEPEPGEPDGPPV